MPAWFQPRLDRRCSSHEEAVVDRLGLGASGTPGNGTMTGLMVAHLADAPTCDVGGADREIIAKAGTSYDGITPYCTD